MDGYFLHGANGIFGNLALLGGPWRPARSSQKCRDERPPVCKAQLTRDRIRRKVAEAIPWGISDSVTGNTSIPSGAKQAAEKGYFRGILMENIPQGLRTYP